jgi:hypothetical protein|tara:strand:+ start:220 stop:456 length:237 start_codon:yes stop_codon:yes gene_type:complete
MKTKNNLTTGIIIGICVIVLPLILMGTSYTTEKQNKFELHPNEKGGVWRLNTENGNVDWISPIGTKSFRTYDLNGEVK